MAKKSLGTRLGEIWKKYVTSPGVQLYTESQIKNLETQVDIAQVILDAMATEPATIAAYLKNVFCFSNKLISAFSTATSFFSTLIKFF